MTPVDPQKTSPSDASPAESVAAEFSSASDASSDLESTDLALAVQSSPLEGVAVEIPSNGLDGLDEEAAAEAEIETIALETTGAVKASVDVVDDEALEQIASSQPLQTKRKATTQSPLHRLKHRPTQLFLLAALATFALGGATSYLLRRPTNGPTSLESAVALVPDAAVASLTLNPKSDPWQELRQLGTPNLQQGLGEWLAVGRDRIVNLGYGNLSAIQQQLAGPPVMALIPLPPVTQPRPGQPPQVDSSDVLLVAPLKNPKAVARSLDERQPPEGFENSISSHRGVKIWDLQVDLVQRQSVAIFGSFGLLASNRTTLERAIDSYKEGTALGDLNEYEDAQRRLGSSDLNSADGALMSFYINGPAAVLSNQAAGRLLPLPTELQGLVSQVRMTEGDELDLNTVTWDRATDDLGVLAQPTPSLGDKPQAMVALGDRFPASTSFLLSGSSIQAAWRSFSQGPASGSSLLSPSALQEQVQAVTSMDLQKDWLSWMDGPYSIGILPIPPQANSRFQTGLTVMAQTSNRRLGERSLQKLDALMVNKYGLSLSTSELDGQPVVNWSNAEGEAVVTHGWLEGNVAFLIVGAPGANLLLPQPRATLAASRLYREGMPRAASQDPAGIMFVDIDRVLDTQLPSLLPLTPSSRPVLEQLKSIGVERRPLDERFSRYDLSLKFLSRSAAPPDTEPAEPEAIDPNTPNTAPSEAGSAETASPEAEVTTPPSNGSELENTTPPAPGSAGEPVPPAETAEPGESTAPEREAQPVGSPQVNQEPSPETSKTAKGDLILGPALPAILPVFGPQLPSQLPVNSEPVSPLEEQQSTLPSNNETTQTNRPAKATSPETISEASDAASSVQQPRKDIIIDPRTAIPVGPPTPSRNFDFAPIGPKLPRPEAQQWSDDFTQSADESQQ